jgi:hypothetical protein
VISLKNYIKNQYRFNVMVFPKRTNLEFIINLFSLVSTSTTTMGVVVAVIVWWLAFQLPVQSVPITTKVVSSNPAQVRCMYSIQHSVIKFVSNLRQVLRFLPPIKLTIMIHLYNWNIVASGTKHHKPNQTTTTYL